MYKLALYCMSALTLFCSLPLRAGGTVYLVLGSDTAVWDGMDVARYTPRYNLSLYVDPALNAYRVMEPSFRLRLTDSYGTPMKLTWWMMAGNIFRYALNTDVPVPNTMTLYLMRKYHGARAAQFGDELSLHYHTFAWTDYNNDGKYYWNQARNFAECRDDFDVTMAQFLLEEDCYPVSFRAGWHYRDNAWQQHLDKLLLYSMDNDYPAKRFVTNEPIDNNFDWSLSSSLWVPFRPSGANYQIGGGSRGWNLRSKHIGSTTAADMNDMFLRASNGADQVACLWGHLPETDFLDNLVKIDSLAHAAAANYPGVTFRYCSAVEAMQRWRRSADTIAPVLTLTEERQGESLALAIQSSEPIYQQQPFVAMKDLYERASVLACTKTGVNTWRAVCPMPASGVAKIAVAVTDTMGNLTKRSLSFLPDDVFIDNRDPGYEEMRGTWTTTTNAAWGADARQAVLAANDSVWSSWSHTVTHTGNHNIFVQVPTIANAALTSVYRIRSGGAVLVERKFSSMMDSKTWVLLGTPMLETGARVTVDRIVNGTGQAGRVAASDVVKISAFVRDRSISARQLFIHAGDVSESDTTTVTVTLMNNGIMPLTVSGVSTSLACVSFAPAGTFQIPAMSAVPVAVKIYSPVMGALADTIRVASNDPLQPVLKLPFTANVIQYFTVADNDDPLSYAETGAWSNSVASDSYGTTSRYASIGGASRARFTKRLPKTGIYDVMGLLPKTVNASVRARYACSINGTVTDSAFVDQNTGSGTWVTYFSRAFPAGVPVEISITDASIDRTENRVLRADAIRFVLKRETAVAGDGAVAIPAAYAMEQNFPNPFNPSTTVRYALPIRSAVRIEVFNALGQRVAMLQEGAREAGRHDALWNSDTPSGIYFVRMHARALDGTGRAYTETRKMMLLR